MPCPSQVMSLSGYAIVTVLVFWLGKSSKNKNCEKAVMLGGEITKSLGNIYSQDVPTGRPGTSLYDVLQSLFDYSN